MFIFDSKRGNGEILGVFPFSLPTRGRNYNQSLSSVHKKPYAKRMQHEVLSTIKDGSIHAVTNTQSRPCRPLMSITNIRSFTSYATCMHIV